ncbi:MAG: hypothetical protein RI883_1006 [Bacteroidota bacterium]|jgi:preprotein translocase subunit SecG
MNTRQTENNDSLFNSPYPLLTRLKEWVFGSEKPDNYTQVTFYLNFVFWVIFFIWSFASYLTISYRHLIFEQKKIPVELIIKARGEVLGFESTDFLNRLLIFHSFSLICWTLVFIGLVLIWRKNEKFVYFFFGGMLLYALMLIFYLNFDYFMDDTTTFDKIILLAMNANALMYFVLLRKEKQGGSLSFFGEDEEEA